MARWSGSGAKDRTVQFAKQCHSFCSGFFYDWLMAMKSQARKPAIENHCLIKLRAILGPWCVNVEAPLVNAVTYDGSVLTAQQSRNGHCPRQDGGLSN
jgi:hypothetical protein